MATQEQMDALLARMRGMSAADLSVLHASAHTPDANMTTSPGSPNQALWSEMVELGWMNQKEDAIDLPGRHSLYDDTLLHSSRRPRTHIELAIEPVKGIAQEGLAILG